MPHNTRAGNRQKSNFPAKSTIPTDSTFDFVSGGTNFKIPVADLLTALGVTGTMVQAGAATGTPVLEKQGSVNVIRSLENGAGILTNVSPENGITIEHNFANGDAGINMIQGIATAQPVMPSLLQGVGIDLSLVDDHITVTATGVVTSTKTVIVNVLADFPAPVAGVITLADNTEYLVSSDVNIGSNTFVLGASGAFKGTSSTVITLTCTKGSGFLFVGTNVTIAMQDIRIDAAGMSLINYDGNSVNGFSMLSSTLLGLTDLGTFKDSASTIFILCFANTLASGVLLTGTNGPFLIENCLVVSCAGAFVDYGTATVTTSTVMGNILGSGASGTLISGLTNNANVVSGGLITAINNRINGGLKLSGVSVEDAQFQFSHNDTIADTRTDGLLSMQGNAVATVIVTQSLAVLAAGTWVIEETSQMTGTTAGRLTLDTVQDSKLPITISVTMEPVSGGSQTMGACVAVNGSIIANSIRTTTTSAGNPVTFLVPWQETLEPTDFVEVYVSNESGTTNVLVSSAIHRIN